MKKERVMTTPLLTSIRSAKILFKTTAYSMMFCYMFVFYSPTVWAIQYAEEKGAFEIEQRQVTEELTELLSQMKHTTSKMVNNFKQAKDTETAKNSREQLLEQYEEYQNLSLEVSEHLSKEKAKFSSLKLSTQAKKQQEEKFKHYDQSLASLDQNLKSVIYAHPKTIVAASTSLNNQLTELLKQPEYHAFDSETMPFGPLANIARKPKTSKSELIKAIGLTRKPIEQLTVHELALVQSNQPTEADLAESIDVQFTDEIKAKATELNNDPVAIYNYVYNNIEFIPSYGSIQGGAYTLLSGRGNATDQSSLLIALLRAANISSRYVYGTVYLPIEEVKNWVGGVEFAESAQNLLGQGGIPHTMITDAAGENMTHVMFEHTWVEAYGQFEGMAEQDWKAMDPSFKQYEYKEAIDIQKAVPFDAQSFSDTLTNAGTINEAEGWVQGIDQVYIQEQMAAYQQQLEDYISTQHPDATVEDVIGAKNIIQRADAVALPNALPYMHIEIQTQFAELPDNMRHKFKFELDDVLSVTKSTAELAGRSMALSFSPASEEDETALDGFLPSTVDELVDAIPAGLMNMKAEFILDGTVHTSYGEFPFGNKLTTRKGFWTPRFGWETTENPVIVGEYQAIGMDLHGLARDTYRNIQKALETSKNKLESDDLASLTKHDITGGILRTGVMGYLGITRIQSAFLAASQDIVYYREPSYGTLSTKFQVDYWLGQPQQVKVSGILLDMDSMKSSAESKINCWDGWNDFNQLSGSLLSASEHGILEQMFSTDNEKPKGVSAVKVIAIAASEGQRIYTIKQNNIDTALPDLTIEPNIKAEIQMAVQLGKVVTISQHNITLNGWTGSGYTIIDPETGAGAYRISGGADGGLITDHGNDFASFGSFVAAMMMLGLAAGPFAGTLIAVALIPLIIIYTGLAISLATGNNTWFIQSINFATIALAAIFSAFAVATKVVATIFGAIISAIGWLFSWWAGEVLD
jgi:hypothetical protein